MSVVGFKDVEEVIASASNADVSQQVWKRCLL
jgi:hypothetical protein